MRQFLVVLFIAVGCEDGFAPVPLPPNAFPFTPEPVYRAWWAQIEQCAGRRGSFDAVRWYAVPGEEPFSVPRHPRPVYGYWNAVENHIVLLQYLPNRRAPIIRHEMLHAILQRTDHPREYFVERCGDDIDGPESPPGWVPPGS